MSNPHTTEDAVTETAIDTDTQDETEEITVEGLAEEWGQPEGAIRAFVEISGEDIAELAEDTFTDAYMGEYDTAKDYAEELMSEAYSEALEAKVLWGVELSAYVDFESIARDLDYNGIHFEESDHYTVYVFDF